jgi:hypothetical protein
MRLAALSADPMSGFLKFGIAGTLLLCAQSVLAQDGEVPLGDVARSYRRSVADPRPVIDNDNLPAVMDKAEAERLNSKPVFSIDPSGKTFRMSSPDGSCSLSFDAKAAPLITAHHSTSSLPFDQLDRLDGTASVHDGIIEVQLHNRTEWDLREIVVGVTLLNEPGPLFRSASLLGPTDGMLIPKPPDTTMLYHLTATVLPDGSTAFRGILDQDLGPATDWHWALVGAKGIPPAAPVQDSAMVKQEAQLPSNAPPTYPNALPQRERRMQEAVATPQP